jgi:hypothetical protein
VPVFSTSYYNKRKQTPAALAELSEYSNKTANTMAQLYMQTLLAVIEHAREESK